MCRLPTVYVRQSDREQTMKITFVYGFSGFPSRDFTFMRTKSEVLETALTRIKSKIQTSVLQKSIRKRKKCAFDVDEVLPPLNIELLRNGVKVCENTKNIDAWSSDTEMVINGQHYKIILNPPSITHISLPKYIASGFPVYPKISFEFCDRDSCVFKWYRSVSKDNVDTTNKEENIINVKDMYWKFIFQGYIYTTQKDDVGNKLRISCIPQSQNQSGVEVDVITPDVILPGPEKCPFEDRHKYTKELTKNAK